MFRNEGVSARHNPEFTSVECYQAYADYTEMMDLTEAIIRACAETVNGSLTVNYQGTEVDLGKPFRRETMNDLVKEATGVDFLGEFGGDGEAGVEAAKAKALEVLKEQEDRGAAAKAAGKVSEGVDCEIWCARL